MGNTKRKSNLTINQRRKQLISDVKRGKQLLFVLVEYSVLLGKENDLAFVLSGYVSITEAKREFKLSEEDLVELDGCAIVATKYGQEGLFYPFADLQ